MPLDVLEIRDFSGSARPGIRFLRALVLLTAMIVPFVIDDSVTVKLSSGR